MRSTVSARGQVSIPATLRKKFHIEAQMELEWVEEGNAIKIIPLPKDPVKAFRGAGRGRYTSDKLVRDRRKERLKEEEYDNRQ
ncbi:MAG: AbrB/MazE/SpoVT family DNA-binding domain-containing protein [Deltaproteobacteria bacterium]|nr:AbrB/MazE/SpoVT family DNA-binding domain-containing protein [Deltaproteobacteria bacterium]MBW1926025.1 AbrB/MazE/SpoVT family DNA-binding domain-containing protein [Deltaproteobacteria bacterium]MBW1966026.1 AbrB/MazE/SpoVT family DNA-binding domain-containing protein [Deltaproteobacteria bacterium]MBW2097457.1 AbrB/MazE/SpoVT family DNA-binding domain-containing protein [Deltaproteobacteria bacterium]